MGNLRHSRQNQPVKKDLLWVRKHTHYSKAHREKDTLPCGVGLRVGRMGSEGGDLGVPIWPLFEGTV